MTDDDLRLTRELRGRADAVRVTHDLADVERRSTERRRRRARAAGTALALVAVVGTIGGFALGRASTDPKETFVATGQALGGGSGDPTGSVSDTGAAYPGGPDGPADYDRPFPFLGERTTDQGLRLRVQVTAHDSGNEGDPCLPDRFVRVGVAGSDVIGVVAVPLFDASSTYAGTTAFTGIVDGRLVQVAVVATAAPSVTATFGDGTVDQADTHDGVAVLAAYDSVTNPEQAISPNAVQLDLDQDQPQEVTSQNPSPCATDGGQSSTSVVPSRGEPDAVLPEPGEQPADAEAARAAVISAWESGQDPTLTKEQRAAFQERPAMWLDATTRFQQERPEYADIAKNVHARVDDVVFTAPDHAAVRYQLLSEDPRNTVAQYQVGVAVLVDGTWRISATTTCKLIDLAGIHCNYDL